MAGENDSSLILPSNHSAASTGSRTRAWGRPLSQSHHQSTENSTGGRSSTSLGALGLSSLGLDDSEKDGDNEGNLRQVEEEIQKRYEDEYLRTVPDDEPDDNLDLLPEGGAESEAGEVQEQSASFPIGTPSLLRSCHRTDAMTRASG